MIVARIDINIYILFRKAQKKQVLFLYYRTCLYNFAAKTEIKGDGERWRHVISIKSFLQPLYLNDIPLGRTRMSDRQFIAYMPQLF